MAYQGTSVSVGTTQPATSGVGASPVNTNGAYLFVWDTQTSTANYINYPAPTTPPETTGALSGVESIVGRYYPSTADITLTANPNDSNNLWLHVPNVGNFPSVSWFNNTNSPRWGYSMGKGWTQFDFMYEGTYAANRLLWQLNSKCPANAALDDSVGNDGVSLRTKSIGGGSAPGVGTASGSVADVQFATAAAGTRYTIHYRWNRMITNANSVRTRILYVLENGGTVRTSNHVSTTTNATKAAAWHQCQLGNDTNTALEMWLGGPTGWYTGDNWQYDLPVNLWQDFEGFAGTSISQAELEAADHNPTVAWRLDGTTSRFTVQNMPGSMSVAPCTIQLWTDSGTKCVRNDLNSTASGSFGFTFTSGSTQRYVGFDLSVNALSSGTNALAAFFGPTDGTSNVCGVRVNNNAGQHELVLVNGAGTASSAVNISADTQYHIAFTAIRNATSTMMVFDTTGAQVGSTVTVAASNVAIGSFRVGSPSATTSQSAGTYLYIRNVVWDNNSTPYFPLKYTEI